MTDENAVAGTAIGSMGTYEISLFLPVRNSTGKRQTHNVGHGN